LCGEGFFLFLSWLLPFLREGGNKTLAINKERKDRIVAEYIDMLQRSSGIVVTEYRGLTMAKFNTIRTKMRDANAQYTVAKNTLLKIH